MPRKTISALLTQADVTLPDNITQDISAADVRQMIKDVVDTFKPGFGAVGIDTLLLPALGVAPVPVTYDTLLAVTADFIAVLAAGTVQRLADGLPSTNTRVTFFTSIACPDGNEVVFSLYRDGAQVPGGTTASGRGIGNLVEASFAIINGVPVAGDPVYEVRASKISGGVDDVELSDVRLILEVVPTLGF